MADKISAEEFLPAKMSLLSLRRASKDCEGCELFQRATQTVFGEGPAKSRLMIVGEVPGDREDLEGRPFVGPAGRLLDACLETAGINRNDVYVTNAVKHFRWEERGKRRMHKKPSWTHIQACRPWLFAELEVVKPKFVLLVGATAAQSLLGKDFRITRQRGNTFDSAYNCVLMATHHPSAILRAPRPDMAATMKREFLHDLKIVAKRLST